MSVTPYLAGIVCCWCRDIAATLATTSPAVLGEASNSFQVVATDPFPLGWASCSQNADLCDAQLGTSFLFSWWDLGSHYLGCSDTLFNASVSPPRSTNVSASQRSPIYGVPPKVTWMPTGIWHCQRNLGVSVMFVRPRMFHSTTASWVFARLLFNFVY